MAHRLLHELNLDDMDPTPWPNSPSIGQTILQHNQTNRFDNVSAMIHYVCVDNFMGPLGKGSEPMWTYVPICQFPYVPSGWNDHGEPGFGDVKFNDCSITLSEAINGYNQQCMMFCLIAFVPFLISCLFLKLTNDRKKKGRNKFWFLVKNPNVSEQLLLLGVLLGLAHTVRCIDVMGFADRVRQDTLYTLSTSICVSSPFHAGFILVRSWITIIDGGKSKKTPKWAAWFCGIGICSTYIIEVSCGLLEYRLNGAQNNYAAIDGKTNSVKMLNGFFWAGSLSIILIMYGRRISKQLRGTKEPSPQFKKIRLMCRICGALSIMGTMMKFAAIFFRQFVVNQMVTPCETISPTIMVTVQMYIIQYGILFANQPTSRGKKMTTRLAEKAAGKKLFESKVSSTETSSIESGASTDSENSSASVGGGGEEAAKASSTPSGNKIMPQ